MVFYGLGQRTGVDFLEYLQIVFRNPNYEDLSRQHGASQICRSQNQEQWVFA